MGVGARPTRGGEIEISEKTGAAASTLKLMGRLPELMTRRLPTSSVRVIWLSCPDGVCGPTSKVYKRSKPAPGAKTKPGSVSQSSWGSAPKGWSTDNLKAARMPGRASAGIKVTSNKLGAKVSKVNGFCSAVRFKAASRAVTKTKAARSSSWDNWPTVASQRKNTISSPWVWHKWAAKVLPATETSISMSSLGSLSTNRISKVSWAPTRSGETVKSASLGASES